MRSGSSGVSDAKSRASKTSAGSGMRLSRLGFDDDLAEELGLLGADPPEADHLHRRQGARRPAPDKRLLGFPRAEPRAERLHVRVRAEALLELESERLALLVQHLGVARVRRHEQLGLEVDERRGHDQVRAGGLEVTELDRLEVGHVLVGDGAYGQPRQVDLVGAAEVQQQVERALEVTHAEREVPGRFEGVRRVRRHGVRVTAARTSSIVACATFRARREPSWRMSTITSGLSANFWRRSRIASSLGTRWRSSTSLQSRQPIPAVRQPVAQASRSAAGVKILCRSNTGQISGLPGSLRRLRAGSVTMGLTLRMTTSAGSER